jgi:two-component system, NtrC family, sensor histidine kinase HydH
VLDERLRDKDRLEKELLQNEKLASMGRMVASIAHEIRNPLGIIRSSAELLLKRQKADGGNATCRCWKPSFTNPNV